MKSRAFGPKENGLRRVQLDFSPEAMARLEGIKKKADAKTTVEVIRDALRLYEWFIEQKKAGYRLHLVRDNKTVEVELLL